MKKVLLIQPHSDDIVLSCFDKLSNTKTKNTILTVENVPKRIAEDEKLLQIFPNLEIIAGVEFNDNSYKEYYSNPHKPFITEDVYDTITNGLGEEKVMEIIECIMGVVNGTKWDRIYTCMGIGHPLHWLVHEITKDHATGFYRDWPHSYKKRNRDFFEQYTKQHFKFVEEVGDEETLEYKKEIFSKFYKSQSGLWFYEQGNVKKNFSEKYYEKL